MPRVRKIPVRLEPLQYIDKAQVALHGSGHGHGNSGKWRNTGSNAGAVKIHEDKPLTDQQLLFVRLWASGETVTTASARAGYSDHATYAYRMIKMPNILKIYRQEKALYEEAAQMTRQRVMDGLLDAVDTAKLLGEPSSMVAGWKTIAQMCGYMAPVKTQIDVNVRGMGKLNQLSDAELLKIINGGVVPMLEHAEEEEEGQ